ncbi:hypothetical protein AIOL_001724 [Candidatus Rhodobacter oscarellae]|uniref:N-acetyltransferase domain-containing protein n=1 Tax=Candidatus Rhodobacter oscarellae TaxID=1675527 RepID=A0A0J9GTE8_9RHOB|nr:GNAT family N-acetyltransferase [Candidatus Rhodobacter lobularis]KMW56768.1 hypothetical protein AIOL_001724 [Candidatus Rhodobacter lobularis]
MSEPGDIRIVPAPRALKDFILRAAHETYEAHNKRQPFAFPRNTFDALIAEDIEFSFLHKSRALPESPNIFAAYLGETPVGYIQLSKWVSADFPLMPDISINDIYVDPEHRGKGVAKAMLTHVKTLCDERGWSNLSATVWDGNIASEALFRDAGFTVQNQTFRYGPQAQAIDYPDAPSPRVFRSIFMPMMVVVILAIVGSYALSFVLERWFGS